MQKVSFALDIEDGWPPVATEHLWCEKEAGVYRLVNAPFFLHGLAYGDKFTAKPDSVNGCIFEFTVLESSGHSLVWVIEHDEIKLESFKSQLLELGCSVEGFPAFNLYAIDIPNVVGANEINVVLDKMQDFGLHLAFPVWRHEPN